MSEGDQYPQEQAPMQEPMQQQQPQQQMQTNPLVQILMQEFQLTEEHATRIAQMLPQVCQGIQQGAQMAQQGPAPQQQMPQQQPIPQNTEGPILNSLDKKDMEGFTIAMARMGISPQESLAILEQMQVQPDSTDFDINDFFNSDMATNDEKFLWQSMTPNQKAEAMSYAADVIDYVGFVANDSWRKENFPWAENDKRSLLAKRLVSSIMPRVNFLQDKKKKEMKQNPITMLMQYPPEIIAYLESIFPMLMMKPEKKAVKNSTDSKLPQMDSITLDISTDTIQLNEKGHLTADCVMAAAMVQDYKGKKVLKDPDELKKACDAAKMLPVTDEHPSEGIVMSQSEIKGWTTPPQWDEDNSRITCSIDIFDKRLIDKIQSDGKTDVSIGFFCDLDDKEGDWQDSKYEAVQRNIVLNHLAAGLDKGRGRCPHGVCGIMKDCAHTDEDDCNCDNIPEELLALPCVGDTHYDWLMQDAEDAKLSAQQRKEMGSEIFAGPNRSFPVPDCSHFSAALRMLGRYQGQGDRMGIRRKIMARGRKLGCPGADELDEDSWDPVADAAILKRAQTNNSTPMKAGKYELLPGRPDTHNHWVTLNAKGNGISSNNDGHTHTVAEFVVGLANDHTHTLLGSDNMEESPMSDEEKKQKNDEEEQKPDEESTDETPSNEEPKPVAEEGSEDEEESAKEESASTDEQDEATKEQKTKLVDSIMDFQPPKPREHYEGKALDELEEIHELLKATSDSVSLPSGSSISAGRQAIDDAYAEVERKLQTK